MGLERAADGGQVIRIDVPVTVRAARVDEMRRLSELWGAKGRASRLRHLRRYFREQADGVQRGLVADFNGNPIGQLWVRLRHIDPAIEAGLAVAYVHTLVVMPEFRRLGVAEGLVRSASALAVQHGCTHVSIGVDRPNEAARRLYAKWGFERYYESFDLRGDLIFMRREVFGSEAIWATGGEDPHSDPLAEAESVGRRFTSGSRA